MLPNGLIINPYSELRSDHRICLFSNKDKFINRSLPINISIENYLFLKFNQKDKYTLSGW